MESNKISLKHWNCDAATYNQKELALWTDNFYKVLRSLYALKTKSLQYMQLKLLYPIKAKIFKCPKFA